MGLRNAPLRSLRQQVELNEDQILDFAEAAKYEEMVAGLADLCAVPIDVVDKLMDGEQPDPILILCKSKGWGWSTARAIIGARLGRKANSSQGLDAAYSNFRKVDGSDRRARDPVLANGAVELTQTRRRTAAAGRRVNGEGHRTSAPARLV